MDIKSAIGDVAGMIGSKITKMKVDNVLYDKLMSLPNISGGTLTGEKNYNIISDTVKKFIKAGQQEKAVEYAKKQNDEIGYQKDVQAMKNRKPRY